MCLLKDTFQSSSKIHNYVKFGMTWFTDDLIYVVNLKRKNSRLVQVEHQRVELDTRVRILLQARIFLFNVLSAHDVISRHAVAQVSLNICKFCFKFLWELNERMLSAEIISALF